MSDTDTETRPTDIEEQAVSQVDYFGFSEISRHYLPDGVSFFELAAMNEGDKAKFQKSTQRDLVLEKGSGNARFKMDPGEERHQLIRASVKGWNLMRQGRLIPFGEAGMRDFLSLANPKVVEELEGAIRKLNPWLINDLTVEEIDKQIEELQEMRAEAEKRESGEGSSSSK